MLQRNYHSQRTISKSTGLIGSLPASPVIYLFVNLFFVPIPLMFYCCKDVMFLAELKVNDIQWWDFFFPLKCKLWPKETVLAPCLRWCHAVCRDITHSSPGHFTWSAWCLPPPPPITLKAAQQGGHWVSKVQSTSFLHLTWVWQRRKSSGRKWDPIWWLLKKKKTSCYVTHQLLVMDYIALQGK